MKIIISILLNGLMVFLISELLPGVFIENYFTAIVTGLVLGAINILIKPIINLLALPLHILSLGVSLLIVNGAMVILADSLISGFDVKNLLWAILFSILMSLLNLFIGDNKLIKNRK